MCNTWKNPRDFHHKPIIGGHLTSPFLQKVTRICHAIVILVVCDDCFESTYRMLVPGTIIPNDPISRENFIRNGSQWGFQTFHMEKKTDHGNVCSHYSRNQRKRRQFDDKKLLEFTLVCEENPLSSSPTLLDTMLLLDRNQPLTLPTKWP